MLLFLFLVTLFFLIRSLYHNYKLKKINSELSEKCEKSLVTNEALESIVNHWINDSWKLISDKLNADNYTQQKEKLEKIFDLCEKYGIELEKSQTDVFFEKLKESWKLEVRIQKAKEEQDRIKEIMKEEAKAEKEREQELKRIEKEKNELIKKRKEQEEKIKVLLELEQLKQLTESQKLELEKAKNQNIELSKEIEDHERQKSMAELTKAGNVYVISNIGSFGENIYKVGMTRRLKAEDRIKELSDASVPFPFDVHMMIPTKDAPALEYKIHEEIWNHRLNLVNDGKEFFKIDLNKLKEIVDKNCDGDYTYIEVPEALQFKESEAKRKHGDFGKHTDAKDEEAA